MRILIAIVLALVLVFGGGSYYKSHQAKRKAQEAAEQVARDKAKKEAEAKAKQADIEKQMRAYFEKILIDPGSVQFRDLKIYTNVPASKLRTADAGEVDVVCGEYNTKNRMGGYVGFKYFYWDSGKNEAFHTTDSTLGPMMEDVARKTCADLK